MKWLLLSFLIMAFPSRAQVDNRQVLVVSGMTEEGSIAAGPGVVSVLSGGSPEILQTVLATIDPSTIRAVVSFGVGGGLGPKLRSGNVVVGTGVVEVETGVSVPTDPTLTAEIVASLQQKHIHVNSGLEAVVDTENLGSTAAQKLEINQQTGALAIDNESMVSAQWAAAHGLPFATLRTVDDPQSLTLPPATLNAINPDGSSNIGEVLESLFQDPGQLGALIEVGIDSSAAFASLRRCRSAVNLGGL